METTRYAFRFGPAYRIPGLLFGITPATTYAELGTAGLAVKFGLWRLDTPVDNITAATLTGDFAWLKTAGPAHLSLVDRGVTFATNGEAAVCVAFRQPVRGIDPTGRIRHPGATLTVENPSALIAHLRMLGVTGTPPA